MNTRHPFSADCMRLAPTFKLYRNLGLTVARECQRANQVSSFGMRLPKASRVGYASVRCWTAGMDTWGTSEHASVARGQGFDMLAEML